MTDNKYTYLLFSILIFSFTITPFLRKKITADFTDEEFFIYSNFFLYLVAMVYAIYLFRTNKCDLSLVKKINGNNLMLCLLAAISGIIGTVIMGILLKRNDTSYIIPQIQPIVILLNLLFAYYLFDENIDIYKVVGVVLIVIGLLIINKSKK